VLNKCHWTLHLVLNTHISTETGSRRSHAACPDRAARDSLL
jgi:hypothetical protein